MYHGGRLVGYLTPALLAEAAEHLRQMLAMGTMPVQASEAVTLPADSSEGCDPPEALGTDTLAEAEVVVNGEPTESHAPVSYAAMLAEPDGRSLPLEPPVASDAAAPVDVVWPAGPHGLSEAAVAALVAQIVVEPRLTSGRPGQIGLSASRLKTLGVPIAQARALLAWFDLAGVLAPPADPERPWDAPRPLLTDDLQTIAALLRTTPVPGAYA
jgi:hypothetical protein